MISDGCSGDELIAFPLTAEQANHLRQHMFQLGHDVDATDDLPQKLYDVVVWVEQDNDLPLDTAGRHLVHRVLVAAPVANIPVANIPVANIPVANILEAEDALSAFGSAMAARGMRDAETGRVYSEAEADAILVRHYGDDERRDHFDERFAALKAGGWRETVDDEALREIFDVLAGYAVALIGLNGGWRDATEDSASVFLRAGKDRAGAIGKEIHAKYGFDGMVFVHDTLNDILAWGSGRELEFAWDGIGAWRC